MRTRSVCLLRILGGRPTVQYGCAVYHIHTDDVNIVRSDANNLYTERQLCIQSEHPGQLAHL